MLPSLNLLPQATRRWVPGQGSGRTGAWLCRARLLRGAPHDRSCSRSGPRSQGTLSPGRWRTPGRRRSPGLPRSRSRGQGAPLTPSRPRRPTTPVSAAGPGTCLPAGLALGTPSPAQTALPRPSGRAVASAAAIRPPEPPLCREADPWALPLCSCLSSSGAGRGGTKGSGVAPVPLTLHLPCMWPLLKGFPRFAAPAEWGAANAVLCCAGSGFRTAGPEDPCQSASNSSPEPRQFPEDKPQVSVQLLLSTLPASASGRSPAWVAQACPSMGSLVPGKAAQRGSCRSDAGMGSHGSLWKPAGLSPRLRGGARAPVSRGSRKPRAGEGRGARSGASHAATLPVSLEVGRGESGPCAYVGTSLCRGGLPFPGPSPPSVPPNGSLAPSNGLHGSPCTCPLQDANSRDVASQDLEVVGPAGGRAKSRATLDELLDTLRLLEEEPEPLPCPRAYHQDKYSWTDQVRTGHGGSCLLRSGPSRGPKGAC